MFQPAIPRKLRAGSWLMKALFIHAHYDDYEFTASGTFELWRRRLGADFRARVLVCTDGAAGHHCRPRAETARVRLAEQQESARLGHYEFALLTLPDGTVPREGCLLVIPPLIAALWQAIREFEPGYLFCPPVPADPLAGIHADHQTVAEAVRRVAYLINVPHAFTPEFPADETRPRAVKTPVILNTHDSYMSGTNAFDLAVNIDEAFPLVAELAWCHQSQIREWLPWVGRHNMAPPESPAAWAEALRRRFERRNLEVGLPPTPLAELFRVTAWGEVPDLAQLERDFPPLLPTASAREALRSRLERWRG